MIGNDLVYIPDWPKLPAERHRRFRQKLYTPLELSLLDNLPVYGEALFWSVKEAIYKIVYRQKPVAFYAPKAFEVKIVEQLGQQFWCRAEYAGTEYISCTDPLPDYLHSVALEKGVSKRFNGVQRQLQPYQRGQPKILIAPNGEEQSIIAKDHFGIPYFKRESALNNSYLSLSHDGYMLALAWLDSTKY